MSNKKSTSLYLRIIHRYLGFFLTGIMAMYALSGIILIFRQTDFLKQEVRVEKELEPNLPPEELGKALKIKEVEVQRITGDIVYFDQGEYDQRSGVANYTTKELPYLLDKMTKLHKATTNSPVYWLNIFFGLSLLFFVISAFWMFMPKTTVFKKGLYFTLAGVVLTVVLLFI